MHPFSPFFQNGLIALTRNGCVSKASKCHGVNHGQLPVPISHLLTNHYSRLMIVLHENSHMSNEGARSHSLFPTWESPHHCSNLFSPIMVASARVCRPSETQGLLAANLTSSRSSPSREGLNFPKAAICSHCRESLALCILSF